MNIAIVYFDMGIGGVQRKIFDIVEYSKKYPHLYFHLLLEYDTSVSFLNQLSNPYVKVTIKEQWFNSQLLKNGKRIAYWIFLAYYLLFFHYDAIIVFLFRPSLYVLLLAKIFFWKRWQIVVSQDVITTDSFIRDKISNFSIQLYSWVINQADSIVFPSHYALTNYVRLFTNVRKKASVLLNWTRLMAPKNFGRYELIIAGRLDEDKKIYTLSSFLTSLGNTHVKIIILGSGKVSHRLQKIFKGVAIKWVDKTTDTRAYLSQAKVLLSFSPSEGMPMTFLEAMGCGTVVVAKSYPGIKEIITNGLDGYICRNEKEMAAITKKILNDSHLRQRIVQAGRKKIKTSYTVTNIERYLHLLKS